MMLRTLIKHVLSRLRPVATTGSGTALHRALPGAVRFSNAEIDGAKEATDIAVFHPDIRQTIQLQRDMNSRLAAAVSCGQTIPKSESLTISAVAANIEGIIVHQAKQIQSKDFTIARQQERIKAQSEYDKGIKETKSNVVLEAEEWQQLHGECHALLEVLELAAQEQSVLMLKHLQSLIQHSEGFAQLPYRFLLAEADLAHFKEAASKALKEQGKVHNMDCLLYDRKICEEVKQIQKVCDGIPRVALYLDQLLETNARLTEFHTLLRYICSQLRSGKPRICPFRIPSLSVFANST
jgi:hypothetical protein